MRFRRATQLVVSLENGAGTLLQAGAALNTVGHPGQAVGHGAPLALYFIDDLYPRPMPMKWARIVACHLMKLVKKQTPYSGGDTHVLELRHYGTADVILNQDTTKRDEQHLGELERAMPILLPDARGRASDETLEERLRRMVGSINQLAGSFFLTAEPGSLEERASHTLLRALRVDPAKVAGVELQHLGRIDGKLVLGARPLKLEKPD